MLCLVAQVCAVAVLAGCASAPGASATDQGVDLKRVGQIERAARHNGVEVYWLNYPRKTGP
jgi:hypothetical protein